MKQKSVTIKKYTTETIKPYDIFIGLQNIYFNSCKISVGYPGLPNETTTLSISEALLYKTPKDGMFEIRLMSSVNWSAQFLLTQISPTPGLLAGTTSEANENTSFNSQEVEKITQSISQLKCKLANSNKYSSEQLTLIGSTLDDINNASNRLGKKDWINYTVGSLTSLCISAGFSTEIRRTLFTLTDNVFSWMFNASVLLIG